MKAGMAHRSRTVLYVILTVAPAAGCADPGRYWRSRALDLWDALPVSVQLGAGLSASAKATPFLGTGAGYHGGPPFFEKHAANSWGMSEGRFGPTWGDHGGGFVLLGWQWQLLTRENESWPSMDRRCEPPFPDYRGTRLRVAALGLTVLGQPPPWYGWLDSEAQVFAGAAGVRVGFCPAQLLDFLTGWFGLDLLGDDPPEEKPPARKPGTPESGAPGAPLSPAPR